MGCDIHVYLERKTASLNYDGPKNLEDERDTKIGEIINEQSLTERWVSADKWSKEDGRWSVSYYDQFYSGRDYYLFSILADVRNGSGVKPISKPRGIPKDASFGYKHMCDAWDGDGHSHSYFTLDELLKVNWSKYEMSDEFLKSIEKMKLIDPDPKKVRICFFFDN